MNIVAKNELTFHNVTFSQVNHDNKIWLTSSELAHALGYKKSDAVTQIYSRYHDEFTDSMSTTLKMSVVRKTGAVDIPVRVFSLRGAHLIAMFATTPKAKEFRRWVLDILDREVAHSPIAKQFTDEELINLSGLWSWMDRSQKLCRSVYPAMRDIESRYTGMFHDIGKETLYVIEESRKVLVRETEHIKNSIRTKRAAALMAKIRGEELPDMYH